MSDENGATMITAGIAKRAPRRVHTSSTRHHAIKSVREIKRKKEKETERKGEIQSRSRGCFFFCTSHNWSTILRHPELTVYPTDNPYFVLCNVFLRGLIVPFNASWTEMQEKCTGYHVIAHSLAGNFTKGWCKFKPKLESVERSIFADFFWTTFFIEIKISIYRI